MKSVELAVSQTWSSFTPVGPRGFLQGAMIRGLIGKGFKSNHVIILFVFVVFAHPPSAANKIITNCWLMAHVVSAPTFFVFQERKIRENEIYNFYWRALGHGPWKVETHCFNLRLATSFGQYKFITLFQCYSFVWICDKLKVFFILNINDWCKLCVVGFAFVLQSHVACLRKVAQFRPNFKSNVIHGCWKSLMISSCRIVNNNDLSLSD